MKLFYSLLSLLACSFATAQDHVGIGTNAPNSKLHILYNSGLSAVQLKLEESQAWYR